MAKKSSLDSPAAAPSPLVASGGGGLLATLPPRQKSKGKAPTSPSSAVGALREVDGMDAGADGDDERTAATKGGRRSSWGKSSAPSSQDSTGMDDLNLRRARQRLNSGRTSSPATSQVDHRAFDGAGRADTNADVARHKIMFTGIADTERYEAVVASLGGLCSNNWSDCTHLVTDKIRRTVKFLAALAAGKHIVSVRWLDQSRKVGGFADEAKFLLKDKAAEKSFGFSLDESLRSAKTVRPFAGLEVYATPSVKPPHADLAEMLNAAGAKLVHTIPHAPPSSGRIAVIGCNEDAAECRRHVDAGWTVHSNEFVLTGILRQAVDWREHVLFGGGGGA
ncbi:hypothetical protein DFJ73DRAFT_17880 [Zopfochytrium polystomum]|nr:hypothetical protein DFJ73DRAFT_17880 [Zopfochytrium polystomum]